jgi:hypothetical protein
MRTFPRPSRRTAGLAVAAGLALVAVSAPASADTADSTVPEAVAAADWLADQLVDGTHFENSGYNDYGLTADAVLALTAAGTEEEAAAAATAWLMTEDDDEANVTGYVGAGTEQYAGAHAKLALTVVARGEDPTDVGGIDLIAGLLALESDAGRFTDVSQWGDYSNVFTQSLAILALERATDDGASEEAVDFLVGAQCPDGGFGTTFPSGGSCVSEADGTAFALQALLAAGADEPAEDAQAWLVAQRGADGSWASDANGTPQPNANSTGVAASALTAAGLDTSLSRTFLVSLQRAGGGISYLPGAAEAPDARATAQAVPALAEVSLIDVAAPAPAPRPTPPAEQPEPEATPTPTPEPEPTDEPTHAPVAGADEDLTNGGTELAATGVRNAPALGFAGLLLLLGTVLLVVTRRPARRPEA